MPINEAVGFHYSDLTPKQQREAVAEVYGLGGNMSPEVTLTYEERVKMRRMLDSLDQKEAGGMREFDLNKPPVPPYQFREYPFVMYDHTSRQSRLARNYEERQQLSALGWTDVPFTADAPPQIQLTAAEQAEAQEIDRKLRKKGEAK